MHGAYCNTSCPLCCHSLFALMCFEKIVQCGLSEKPYRPDSKWVWQHGELSHSNLIKKLKLKLLNPWSSCKPKNFSLMFLQRRSRQGRYWQVLMLLLFYFTVPKSQDIKPTKSCLYCLHSKRRERWLFWTRTMATLCLLQQWIILLFVSLPWLQRRNREENRNFMGDASFRLSCLCPITQGTSVFQEGYWKWNLGICKLCVCAHFSGEVVMQDIYHRPCQRLTLCCWAVLSTPMDCLKTQTSWK